ncbi:MAG: hypothetical protein ACREO4_06425 [Lysobacter sp.]
MILAASLGLRATDGVAVLAEPIAGGVQRSRPQVRDDTSHLELIMRFCAWAHQLRRFPTIAATRARFDISRATAYRWRDALAAAHGIPTPADGADEYPTEQENDHG